MRYIFIFFLLSICLLGSASTYFVSPDGNDVFGNGSIGNPWFTLNKAWTVITAGDTIYMRGGTYNYVKQDLFDKSGAADNLIKIWAYPGESPVLKKSGSYADIYWPRAIIRITGDYIHLKGLEICYNTQESNAFYYGLIIYNGNNNICEYLNIHHNGGTGLSIENSSVGNLILNCDIHHNSDPLSSDKYGNADGIGISNIPAGSTNTIRGCRFWWNSDDGIDLWQNESAALIDNCWSWNNGFIPDTYTNAGDGNGFKIGITSINHGNKTLRVIKNCIAYHNRQVGFDQNGALCRTEMFNNTSFLNGKNGFKFISPDIVTLVKNNISINDPYESDFSNNSILENNSFLQDGEINTKYNVTDEDFVSLDETQLSKTRKASGSLPDIDFMHLASGSDLIDTGSDVGLIYDGIAPDLGYAEYLTGSVPNPFPIYKSSSIANTTPYILEIIYNLPLANIIPPTSSFSVLVNSASRTVSSVSISGTKVYLTLATPASYGDVITIAYSKPSSNSLQTSLGGQAPLFSAKNVINYVAAVPVYVNSVINNSNPYILEMAYNNTLANIVPSTSAFIVMFNSSVRNVSSVTISGSKVLLSFSARAFSSDMITVTYAKPSSNPLQTSLGGYAESITAKSVTNNVAPIPVYMSSVINNSTPSILEMTYNNTLANIGPSTSAFTVMVNSSVRNVSSMTISGLKVLLTLESRVFSSDIVTVSYSPPSVNPLQTPMGGHAVTVTAKSVTNNVAPIPVYTSSAINNSTPSILEMTYNNPLANIVPSTSAFTVIVNSSVRSVSSVAISGSKVLLTLANRIFNSDIITVAYTKPSSNPLQTLLGGLAVSITAKSVSNNCVNIPPVISIVAPIKGSEFVSPATINFDAQTSDPDGQVSKVSFYNGNVKIGELTSFPYSFTWKNVQAGTYSVKVAATDNLGAVTFTAPLDLIVNEDAIISSVSSTYNKYGSIKLYPNPNKGIFTLDLTELVEINDGEINILSIEGKYVLKENLFEGQTSKQYNLSHIAPGKYILFINSSGKSISGKFIKY